MTRFSASSLLLAISLAIPPISAFAQQSPAATPSVTTSTAEQPKAPMTGTKTAETTAKTPAHATKTANATKVHAKINTTVPAKTAEPTKS